MRKTTKVALGGATTLALCTAGIAPAFADPNPIGTSNSNGDIVGVGSDTLQFVDDFVADGNSLTNGYNFYNKTQRLDSFDAVDPWTQLAGNPIKLRGTGAASYTASGALNTAGYLITRPNGSGAGQNYVAPNTTCISSATPNTHIDYARSSSALSTGAKASGCLTEAPFASDTIQIAVSKAGTLAPSAGITPRQLKEIYEQSTPDSVNEPLIRFWDQLDSSLPHTAITPVLPQAGSGTRKTFLQAIGLTDANGNETNVRTDQVNTVNNANAPVAGQLNITEEHNPQIFVTAAAASTPFANSIIAPFSGGRASLVAAGFFNFLNLGNTAAQTAYSNSISLLPGTSAGYTNSPDTAYGQTRPLFHDYRQSQENQAWVSSMNQFFCASSTTPLIQAAGLTQLTTGCGVNNP